MLGYTSIKHHNLTYDTTTNNIDHNTLLDNGHGYSHHNHSLASFLSLTNNNKNEDRWTMGLLMGYYVNMKTGPSLAHEFTYRQYVIIFQWSVI